jgi:hypothetical protein
MIRFSQGVSPTTHGSPESAKTSNTGKGRRKARHWPSSLRIARRLSGKRPKRVPGVPRSRRR